MTKKQLDEYKIKAHRLLNQGKFVEAFLSFMKDLEEDEEYKGVTEKMAEYGMIQVVYKNYGGFKNWIDGFR